MNKNEFKRHAIGIDTLARELREIPAGHLYAHLMGEMSLDEFNEIIKFLVDAKRVEYQSNHLLRSLV